MTALSGTWTGTLEYRDYRSDRRVTLPTTLIVTAGGERVMRLVYTYDDGPGKTVVSEETVTIDPAASSYRIQNGDGTYDATFLAPGLAAFGAASGTVVLMGQGTENDAPVELRITLQIDRDSFTMLRESRRAGAEWLFRNQYRLARAAR